ncbi:hypothetical protein ABIA39_009069 [Nocardia sp. GAS34]|uniref:hypothetical protein n=1 Tax=unclassified Nocardia TaxID=2637762 RepID=UPI003D2375A3
MPAIVSIDIEPGGRSTPVGYIGICEVGCDGVGTPTLIRFRSPLCQYSWGEWVTSCEDQLAEIHAMRSETEQEHLHGRWDISDDIEQHTRLFGFSPLPDPFDQAEYRRPEPATFSQVWAELAPRLDGRILTAYNAAYDKAALDSLLQLTYPHGPNTNYRWIDGLAVARHYKFWRGRYGSPTEKLWRELFGWDRCSDDMEDIEDLMYANDLLRHNGIEEYLEYRRQQELENPQYGAVVECRGERLQDVALRLELFTGDQARLRALAHREWGVGNKALLRNAAEDAWANAEVIAASLRAESLPLTTDGIDILDAVIVDPDPTIYPAHQAHLAAIEPIDPRCAQFLATRAQAQIDRCIRRICGIQLNPEQWTEVYEVWEAATRWQLRLAGISEAERPRALAAKADGMIQASRSALVCHQRGKVYANALSNWLEANRKQLAFQGHTDEAIGVEISRLRDEEEQDWVQRRRRTHKR